MESSNGRAVDARLPVTRNLTLLYVLSLLTALIMAVASAAGLLYPARVYPTAVLQATFWANDVVNLALGVPILIGSMWLTRRGKLVGLLFWPGALMFVLYNYIAYVFGTPPGWVFMLYLVLVPLSAYTLIWLVASIDGQAVKRRLAGAVPERLAGGVLVGLGALILVRVIAVLAGALVSGETVAATDMPVLIADSLLSPAWVIGGALLWQRKALGYVSGVGLLFQTSMLFAGLVAFLLLQPLFTGAPLAVMDVVVVAVMGLVCSIPFALVVRGAARKGR